MSHRHARARRIAVIAAMSVAVSVLVVPSAPAAQLPAPAVQSAGSTQTAANKALVTYFYDQLFNKGDLSVIDRYVSPGYIQHNPTVADGPEALRTLIVNRKAATPQAQNTVERVVAQGDLVLIQSNGQNTPGTTGIEVVDVFRVSGGKIVEHWDTLQPVPASTASGNDLFSTLSRPQTSATGPAVLTQSSERTVSAYFAGLNQGHDLTAVDRYVSKTLYQHDPSLADGSAAVKAAYAARFAAFPESIVSSELVVGQGDLVSVRYHYQSSAADLGQAVTEIFRVRDGRIVEHWAAAQPVPATSANGNTMF
jgi:predicted SnoaL-like aldol condensation-catalyzing enzyme